MTLTGMFALCGGPSRLTIPLTVTVGPVVVVCAWASPSTLATVTKDAAKHAARRAAPEKIRLRGDGRIGRSISIVHATDFGVRIPRISRGMAPLGAVPVNAKVARATVAFRSA